MVIETNTITKEKRTTNGKRTYRITAVGRRNTDIRRTWVLSVLAILFALCMLMGRTSDVRAEETETTENENILAVVTEPDGEEYNITNAEQLFGEQGEKVKPGSTVTLMQDFTRNGTDANSRAALILRNSECSLSSMKKLILKNAKIQAAGSLYDINILIPSGCSADITATSLGQENHPGTITVEKGAVFYNHIANAQYGQIIYMTAEETIQPDTSSENTTGVTAPSDSAVGDALDVSRCDAAVSWKKKALVVRWNQVAGVDGYDIFVSQGKKTPKAGDLVKSVQGAGKVSIRIKKRNGKKLNQKKNYQVKVRAYRMVNGEKQYVSSSVTLCIAGRNSTYTNAKNIRLAAKKITLKKGRQTKIQATVVRQNNKKALLPKSYVANLRYESSNTKVAAVTKNGKIKAKKRGTCTITITAANGVRKQVKVKVK
ncbi:MAG TPA: Ig-like domain-containing protein [Candidatus Anaerobutyricum faecale]|nr:Ig-like domain-containing protein [Candidatus Anaerobutyricum faecale]